MSDGLDAAPTLEVLNALIDVAAGLQRRWKPVKDVADRAGMCWVAAETKLGEEKRKMPKAKGTLGQFAGGKVGSGRGIKKPGGAIIEPPGLDTPTIAQMGLGKKQAARAEKLAALPAEERAEIIEALVAEGKPG